MVFGKLSFLTAPFLLLIVIQNGLAEDGNKAKCESQSGNDCRACLRYAQCYFCTATKKCAFYPWKSIIPKMDVCSLTDTHWGTCWVNFLALIISLLVVVFVVATTVALWCRSRCGRCRRHSAERDEQRYAQQRQDMLDAQAQRRSERQTVADAMRQKYGVAVKQTPPYQPLQTAGVPKSSRHL